MVDVDYLVSVMREQTGITADELTAADISFEMAVTDAETGGARYVDIAACASESEIVDALRATMAIPVLYPVKAYVDGRHSLDGGIADPLPVLRAALRRPSLIIAISSVGVGDLAAPAEGREARILRLAPGIPGLVRHLMLTRNPLADATEDIMRLGSIGDIPIVRIVPSRPELLGHRLETDRDRLLELERLGYEDGVAALRGAEATFAATV
jgi:predicted patatin/cPLA2 family phospholipase